MEENKNSLNDFINKIENTKMPKYKKLPDVPLYMDQIVNYIKDMLESLGIKEQNEITSFMINNYVKANIINRPKDKKYGKTQLAYIIGIVFLKKVTSISNVSLVVNASKENDKNDDFIEKKYDYFCKLFEENLSETLKYVKLSLDTMQKKVKQNTKKLESDELKEKYNQGLLFLALRLFIKAEVNKIFAEKLIYEVANDMNSTLILENNKNVEKANKKLLKQQSKMIKKANVSNLQKEDMKNKKGDKSNEQ